MMYNGVNSTIGYYRGKHDAMNSVAAGGISGAVFRSTRGVRPAMISGGIVASVAGAWAVRILPELRLERTSNANTSQVARKAFFEH